jgi:outer membrane murein-binding lipoprotein Lpp
VKHRVWKAVTGLVGGALVVSAVAAAVLIVNGCSSRRKYSHVVRNNPECVGEADIKMSKVDSCLNTTDGLRASVDSCLVGQGVPTYKVDRMNVCLGVEHSPGSY